MVLGCTTPFHTSRKLTAALRPEFSASRMQTEHSISTHSAKRALENPLFLKRSHAKISTPGVGSRSLILTVISLIV